jgi:hypothetical protein
LLSAASDAPASVVEDVAEAELAVLDAAFEAAEGGADALEPPHEDAIKKSPASAALCELAREARLLRRSRRWLIERSC